MAVGVSIAREMGVRTVVSSTTGNAGISLAAYAAAGGLDAVVLAAEAADPAKLRAMAAYGARVVRVGGSVSDAYHLGVEASKQWGWMNLTSTFLNPFAVEGHRSVGYELVGQLGKVPDYIVVPVSVGPLLVETFMAIRDCSSGRGAGKEPKMIAVQAAECAPIAKAYDRGDERVSAWNAAPNTVASGIADPLLGYEEEGTYALRVVRASGGCVIACEEEAIGDAQRFLATTEGVLGEATGTIGIAALHELVRRMDPPTDSVIVVIMTGSGARKPPDWLPNMASVESVPATLDALSDALDNRSPGLVS